MKKLSEIYDRKLDSGILHPDADQRQVIGALEKLCQEMAVKKTAGGWKKILKKTTPLLPPKGFYFHGGVGRGKSMVMDLFFDAAPVEKKRRVHFHAFMLEVHDFLHTARTARKKEDVNRIDGDLIAFADKISREARLLCFDEFQVKDVADAMILGRLFTALFERGVVTVITSNIAPDGLYEDGLQRDRFIPFIELLKKKLHVFHFSGETDYRLDRLRGSKVYFHPHDKKAEKEMENIFRMFADGAGEGPLDISVKGRVIHVPRAARDAAEFTFEELCGQPKSALDYLELVKRFRVFIVKDVPKLTDDRRDATLRFITFIDTLYDHHAHLVISAAATPENLYEGRDNAHAFKRTASRLMDMQSREYRENQARAATGSDGE